MGDTKAAEGAEELPSQFGRYTLVDRLATGGMAEVFKAKILSTHGFEKLLVIKRILPHLAADKTFVSMFIDEAKLTAQLSHPKIVQVTDFGDVKGQYFIALEFVDGFDALALLKTSSQRKIRIPVPISMFITMEVLDALDYAHNARDAEGKPMRLVHRDISPSNVFISRRGDVKLGDFGIAHAQERESKTQAGTLKGKYGYMSPEQVVGATLDGRSDLFAVGVVLAEMLMGRRLFTAPNDLDVLLMVRDGRLERWDKFAENVPPDLDKITRKALEKRVGDRYQNAGEFRDALADFLFKAGVRVAPPDVGHLASDFFDNSPEATARVMALLRKWDVKTPTGAKAPPPPAPAPPEKPSPRTAVVATGARQEPPDEDTPAVTTPVGPVLSDEGLEVEIEEDVGARAQGAAETAGKEASVKMAAALDDSLSASAPLSVVDLDQYDTPGGGDPMPGVPFDVGPITPVPMVTATRSQTSSPDVALSQNPDRGGDLAAVSPMRIFSELATGSETGLLRFELSPHIKEVYLVRGAPESVNSNLASDRFGEYAVSRGFIKPADLEKALAQLPRFSGKLGDTLVGLGLMRPLDVFRLLSQQVRERVMEIFGWIQGYYSFRRNVRNPLEAFPLGLDTFEILGAGVLSLSYDFLQRRFVPLLDRRPRANKSPRLSPDAFRLGPTPRELCALLDGKRTLRDWVGRFNDANELLTFLRTLYLLVESDLVQFG